MNSYSMSLATTSLFPSPIGGTPTKEGEISMIRSLHASRAAGGSAISYGYTGVALASSLSGISRGDRFQGRFRFSAGLLEGDGAESVARDHEGGLSLIIGRYHLISDGALTIQRLVTPQFYRIAIRCDEFAECPEEVKRVNLAFYSDPDYCAGDEFRLDRLDIGKIPMPSLYLETDGGRPVINAKLQSLDRISGSGS